MTQSSNTFENDIFISYAHIDNQVLSESQKGWISKFHESLRTRIAQYLGKQPKIWFDNVQLRGDDYIGRESDRNTIVMQFPKINLLISVLSPSYLNSEWCKKELHEFYESCKQRGGVLDGNKSRIFKVIKFPVENAKLPEEALNVTGYEFFELEGGRARALEPDFGDKYNQKFLLKIDDLAQDIADQLKKSYAAVTAPETNAVPAQLSSVDIAKQAGKRIYIAFCEPDLQNDRDRIRRELEQAGHTVLPDQPFSAKYEDAQEEIAKILSHSDVSIHLFGSSYGRILADGEYSLEHLQYQMASIQANESPSFALKLWLANNDTVDDHKQKHLIKLLKENPEYRQTTFVSFIDDVLHSLDVNREAPTASGELSPSTQPTVYVMVDPIDIDACDPIFTFLDQNHINLKLPTLGMDEGEARKEHESNLLTCDGILIYYGDVKVPWIEKKLSDLKKARGWGTMTPKKAIAMYLSYPQNSIKKRMSPPSGVEMIVGSQIFEPADLSSFMESLLKQD